ELNPLQLLFDHPVYGVAAATTHTHNLHAGVLGRVLLELEYHRAQYSTALDGTSVDQPEKEPTAIWLDGLTTFAAGRSGNDSGNVDIFIAVHTGGSANISESAGTATSFRRSRHTKFSTSGVEKFSTTACCKQSCDASPQDPLQIRRFRLHYCAAELFGSQCDVVHVVRRGHTGNRTSSEEILQPGFHAMRQLVHTRSLDVHAPGRSGRPAKREAVRPVLGEPHNGREPRRVHCLTKTTHALGWNPDPHSGAEHLRCQVSNSVHHCCAAREHDTRAQTAAVSRPIHLPL